MEKWARIKYQPCLPLGDNNSKVTGSKRHIEISKRAATEGAVLLKNENETLPLKEGTRIAIFGKAQIDYVKGGRGSGDTFCEYITGIYDGLKLKSDKVEIFDELSLYYKNYVENEYKNGKETGRFDEAELPKDLLVAAKTFTDTAIITLCRSSGEGSDRYNDGNDKYFILSENEKKTVKAVCDNFENVIVLINTGAMIDTKWFAENEKIGAALMLWQGGIEGGLSAAELLLGEANPSGKLVDTCAKSFDDYPSSATFHESEDYVQYTEDIFVGYRYFETVPGKKDCVVYPFGFGLSYTTFEIFDVSATQIGDKILIYASVKNTGSYAGKEVVQVYFSAPRGKITKAQKELCAFKKTRLLAPNETETLVLELNIAQMASYDDLGVVEKSAYVLESGEYKFFVGNSVRAAEIAYKYAIKDDVVLEKLTQYCAPRALEKRLTENGKYEKAQNSCEDLKKFLPIEHCKENFPEKDEDIKKLIDVANGEISLDEFAQQLTNEEMASLLEGKKSTGVANVDGMGGNLKYGIPTPMTTDGPAGVRINPETGVRVTAFPVATCLACTWNTALLEEVGKAGALEAKENNLSIWLTPALNIHRNPLCGRNFEYYSEDPYLSGKMAAATVCGIQSQNIAATAKHFACNNKETNRRKSDSVVSERALREIYLKGFEICVKEAAPKMIMTSYNKLNGTYTAENAELIEGILRGEWGFEGLVTTDWSGLSVRQNEISAGNDIKMPSISLASTFSKSGYKLDKLQRDELASCVKRLLKMILWFE